MTPALKSVCTTCNGQTCLNLTKVIFSVGVQIEFLYPSVDLNKVKDPFTSTLYVQSINKLRLIYNMETTENKKKSTWDIILKLIIAVASAIAGVLGASAMSL